MSTASQLRNQAPKLPMRVVEKPFLMNMLRDNTMQIEMTNIDILKKLLTIYTTKGKVSSFRSRPPPTPKSNIIAKNREESVIRRENEIYFSAINNVKSTVPTLEASKLHWHQFEKAVAERSAFPLYWKTGIDYAQPQYLPGEHQFVTEKSLKFKDKRPRVALEIFNETTNTSLGRIIIILYSDYVPVTCKIFLNFCNKSTQGYTGCYVNCIIPDLFLVTGDILNDFGGSSAYGPGHPENYLIQHNAPGIVSMCNNEENNGTQFLITFEATPSMDGKYVGFGKVVAGFKTLQMIRCYGTWGVPRATLKLASVMEI